MLNTEKIRNLMESKGLNNAELAERTGVTEAMVSYVLRGLREPSYRLIVNIAKALGCSLDEITIK